MEIQPNADNRTIFSPWGKKITPFTDQSFRGEDVVVPPGTSLPQLAKYYYGNIKVDQFIGNYPFLDRDHKTRSYDPGADDPFVFRNNASIQEFKEEARDIVDYITEEWKALGLPIVKDAKKGITVPDGDAIFDPNQKEAFDTYTRHPEEASFLLGNFDIARKFCIVRGIPPGWWASSYAGSGKAKVADFSRALDIIIRADRTIRASKAFKEKYDSFMSTTGDPLYSNVGYPFMVSTVDANGAPLARMSTVDLFREVGNCNWNWPEVVKEIDRRGRRFFPAGYPFATTQVRRQQYGDKPHHSFKETSYGLETQYDVTGYNTVRIAFIVPYIFNLYASPLALDMKANRALTPGCYNDGPIMAARTQWLRKGTIFIAEGDYSNYDRTIPYNIVMAHFDGVYKDEPHYQYWRDLLEHSINKLPLVWPDYIKGGKGRGHIFYPGALGLLSGIKWTPEIGTKINEIVCVDALLNAGIMNDEEMYNYLIRHADGSQNGSKFEYFDLQSDDAQLNAHSLAELVLFGDSFLASAKKMGLKTKFQAGDRYLMRHMFKGRNSPVPCRIWQNTISNEDSYTEPIKFIVGLASRTDGIFGMKTVDPFGTGKHRSITGTERRVTLYILQSVLKFLTTAKSPVPEAIAFIKLLMEAGKSGDPLDATRWKMPDMYIPLINDKRRGYAAALAKMELSKMDSLTTVEHNGFTYSFVKPKAMDSMLMQLRSNAYSLSAQLTLDELIDSSPDFAKANKIATEVEHQFYTNAMHTVNIPTSL